MVELAPYHKTGLILSSPILIASGFCGYGDSYQRLLDISKFGAVVTQPITLRPQRGAPQPRLVETKAGFILNTGYQNSGVKKVLRRYSKIWSRLKVPVIAHLPADDPDDLMRTARALSGVLTPQGSSVLAAIELGLPHQARYQDVEPWIRAIHKGSELPLLVKFPLNAPFEVAEAVANASADGLIIGTSPLGAALSSLQNRTVTGHLYGPALFNQMLHNLQSISDLGLPLIATGGIHSISDVQLVLKAGATAAQLDSLLFIDPHAAGDIAKHFHQITSAYLNETSNIIKDR